MGIPAHTDVAIILCRVQGPINVGMIARLCGNFGVPDLRLVDPQCELDGDDARRFANHAQDLLKRVRIFPDLSAALADRQLAIATTARTRDERFPAARSLAAVQEDLQSCPVERLALVFGNEAHGLNNHELSECPWHCHLETPGDYPSYNLANAVAIVGHQLLCDRQPQPPAQRPAADAALVRRLEQYWLESLERFNHFRGNRRRADFAPHFRQLLHRLKLDKEDATTLFACLAQFNYFTFGDKYTPTTDDPQPPAAAPKSTADKGAP